MTPGAPVHTAAGLPLPVVDPALVISRGYASGLTGVNKFGRNPDCDPAASATAVPVGRDVWDLGIAGAAAWVPPTAARVHQLSSSDDEDGGAGTDTGALTIRVYGLDEDFLLQSETVTLAGTANAATANAYTMIYRMECLTFGSSGRNLGDIDATADVDGTVTARVSADMSQTLMAIYQVPAGKTGYVTGWYGHIYKQGGAAQIADVILMSKRTGAGWRVRDLGVASTGGQDGFQRRYMPYKHLAEKELVKIAADPSAAAQDIGAGFDMILVDQ